MELSSGSPRRSSQQLGPGSGGEDRISALDDDMLLLVLARLGCFRAAARTGALSRRWRGIWASLRHVVFRDVPFLSLGAALARVPRPPPGLSLLEIRVTDRQPRPSAAGVTSLLRAAAMLEPKKLVVALPSGYLESRSPMFFLRLPAHARFPELETLSLSGCLVRFDSLLPWRPRLRVLRIKFDDNCFSQDILSVHSASLQELFVEAGNVYVNTVDLIAPELKQLTVSLKAYGKVNISSMSAPMLERLSWQWSYPFDAIKFGLWRITKLRLQTAQRQGELPSLHIHARITSSIVHGEVENTMHEIEKHLIVAKFSALELHLKSKGHVNGALVFHLLGMNRPFRATQRLKVVLHRSVVKQDCPLDCACDHPDWRSQTISLTALEQVEIDGFDGYDHEIDFLKLIFRCAPLLKRMSVTLSHEVSSRDDGCAQIHIIFRDYSSVECYLYLSSGLMHGIDDYPST